VVKGLENNPEVIEAQSGNNLEENKKYIFGKQLELLMLQFVNENFDFYKSVSDGDQKRYFQDVLYANFKKKYNNGEIPMNLKLYDREGGDLDIVAEDSPS